MILQSIYHSAGKALTSDWFVNSFIMLVYEKIRGAYQLLSVQGTNKKFFSKTIIIEQFTDRSEVSVLPLGRLCSKSHAI